MIGCLLFVVVSLKKVGGKGFEIFVVWQHRPTGIACIFHRGYLPPALYEVETTVDYGFPADDKTWETKVQKKEGWKHSR